MTWATSANFGLPMPLCSRLSPDVRDRQTEVRQTDVRQHHRLMSPPRGRGHNKTEDKQSGLVVFATSGQETDRVYFNRGALMRPGPWSRMSTSIDDP